MSTEQDHGGSPDASLDALLADPETKEPLKRATDAQLAALRDAIASGAARRADGEPPPASIDGAYLPRGRRWAYPIVDGVPSFLVEARLELETAL